MVAARTRTRSPLPPMVPPMLAAVAKAPPTGPGWAFEYKWDGVRACIRWDGAGLSLVSRLGNDVTRRYPELASLAAALGSRPIILDGEIVALDEQARPSFGLLQHRMHVASPAESLRLSRQIPAVLMLFDVLWLGDGPLLDRPYLERRETLATLNLSAAHWQTPPHYIGGGGQLLTAARRAGLEGIVAKKIDGPYRPGRRSDEWRKIKLYHRQEFVIGGWTPGKGTRSGAIGALLLGYHDHGRLRFAGKVGSGLDGDDQALLLPQLRQLARRDSPFDDPVPHREARYVQPRLVAEVKFAEWTRGDTLRHPVFQGLREDKKPETVIREQP